MKVSRHHSIKKERAQYLLLGLPTLLIVAYGLSLTSQWTGLSEKEWLIPAGLFGAGLFSAIYLFARRYRFITLTATIFIAFFLMKWGLSLFIHSEFGMYFIGAKANVLFGLFMVGWIAGYGFSRSRFFSIAWTTGILSVLLVILALFTNPTRNEIALASIPVLVYGLYIIFTVEFVRNTNEDQLGFSWLALRRITGFLILMGIILATLFVIMKTDFDVLEKNWGEKRSPKENNDRQNSLIRDDGKGISTRNSMGMAGNNSQSYKDSLLFVAHLDNFFEDEETPNPLYFVSEYLTRYDSASQTFETDSLQPSQDLFQPDLLSLPLYFKEEDTTILNATIHQKETHSVTAEIYKTLLSPRLFTAPATAYFVQPISVPVSEKNTYKSAYRTKMMVSNLNSAYFVYNPASSMELSYFQEQRFERLRTIQDFSNAPDSFKSYFTQMPAGEAYDSIRQLAADIVQQSEAMKPIDQVIAVRNYFTAPDSSGIQSFKYTDNPGIPGIPGINKLSYFLFDSKRGYCAYYAGATLFMLRSLGIPCRIATGFLTVDRSNKNPGWYWFYGDQAHAWVQVWFPDYGWLDFDTTVPSLETQEAPQPDRTPPLSTQTAWWVANGIIRSIDTTSKTLAMQATDLLYHDEPFELKPPVPFLLDIKIANVLSDTGKVDITLLQPGMRISAVSFASVFKELSLKKGQKKESLFSSFPGQIPVDEIKIIKPEKELPDALSENAGTAVNWWKLINGMFIVIMSVVLLSFIFPYACFLWFTFKARQQKDIRHEAYFSYMACLFYLHQLGFRRRKESPLQFAEGRIDRRFGTQFSTFVKTYQKLKYSKTALTKEEERIIHHLHPSFVKTIRSSIPFSTRFNQFINPFIAMDFFTESNILGSTGKK